MNRREKLSAAFILTGMVLLCAEQLAGCIAGVVLLSVGTLILNIKKKAARSNRRRHRKNYSTTSYQKAKEMSRCSK